MSEAAELIQLQSLANSIRAEYAGQLDALRRSVGRVIARADLSDIVRNGDTWEWRGDGTDHLDHMPGDMVVAIRAEDLRRLINPQQAQQEPEQAPSHGDGAQAHPRVLDPCCGGRMMWFDRENPDVLFGDQRAETLTVTDNSRGNRTGTRTVFIQPDTLLDFRALPFPDGAFSLVAFDPPHLVQAGPRSWLAAKYGKLGPDWREDLRQGFVECFRVLRPNGVLVFKWNETQVKLSEVLALTPHAPLFGNTSGKKAGTHWLVFMRPAEA